MIVHIIFKHLFFFLLNIASIFFQACSCCGFKALPVPLVSARFGQVGILCNNIPDGVGFRIKLLKRRAEDSKKISRKDDKRRSSFLFYSDEYLFL